MTLPQHCCRLTKATKIKVEQNGKKAVFDNKEKLSYTKICVDGCVLRNTKAADFVVSQESVGDAVIELKGRDVEEAVKQVCATANHWIRNNYSKKKIAALIVATGYPKANMSLRRAQEAFAKDFRGPLHVVTSNYQGSLEAVLSFHGPYKV